MILWFLISKMLFFKRQCKDKKKLKGKKIKWQKSGRVDKLTSEQVDK